MVLDVLLVDDSSITRRAQRRMLEIGGIPLGKVAEAEDGMDALEAMLVHKYHLVLCDLHMPRMGGVAVLAAVRRDPRYGSPKVVFVSSDHSETRQQRLLTAGAEAFLKKPLTPEKLISVLERIYPDLEAA
jgi:two-component system chemotaxis response regulator CheY